MWVKIHTGKDGKTLLAVCDSELLGKKFEEGRLQLDLTTSFYRGEKKNKKEVADLMRNADMVNLVGEEAIAVAASEELLSPENVKRIAGIPLFQSLSPHEP